MKVLQILYSGLGGHGSVVTSLIDADKDREWEHQVLFYGIEDILPDYKKFCITRNIPFSFVKKERGALKTGGRAVKSVLKKYNPDVIILHSPGLIFFSIWRYCLLNRKKIFVVEHTSNDAKGFVELLAGFFAILLARKVVYLSPFYQQQMKRKFWLLPVLKRSVVIQNGIDLEKFKPSGKSVIEHELNAGMIGRFILPKDQTLIVEALEKGIHSGSFHRKIIIHFAGNGGSLLKLQEAVQKKNVQDVVRFHGLLNEEEIVGFLGKLDFYVHASYAETMCTAVMQAMACGLPVVASNIPGINNIVKEEENALLFENNMIGTIIGDLVIMQEDKRRKKMSESSRLYAEDNFSSLLTFQRYNTLVSKN